MGKIRVFSIKVALATMCAGKLMDKLRCKYSLTSDILFSHLQQKDILASSSPSYLSSPSPFPWHACAGNAFM